MNCVAQQSAAGADEDVPVSECVRKAQRILRIERSNVVVRATLSLCLLQRGTLLIVRGSLLVNVHH